MGYLPGHELESETAFEFVKNISFSLARLDDFSTTAVACICSDRMDEVGSHHQTPYH